MQEQTITSKAKKAAAPVRDAATAATNAVKDATDSQFSLETLTRGLRDQVASFDRSPLAYVKENPLRATFIGFFIGLIFRSALSKRAVTK